MVHLELYWQRFHHVWTGNGQVYVLKDPKHHTCNLWCRCADAICYGASVTTDDGIFWGVGRDDKQGCRRRCYECVGGNAGPITLVQ